MQKGIAVFHKISHDLVSHLINPCRYLPTNEDGVQRMHRYVNSEDVEQYPDDTHPRDILLTKDEDFEYKSGILYHSSGTTFVEISISPQRKVQQFADEEESSSNLTNLHTFSSLTKPTGCRRATAMLTYQTWTQKKIL